jgi:hypothetical protein
MVQKIKWEKQSATADCFIFSTVFVVITGLAHHFQHIHAWPAATISATNVALVMFNADRLVTIMVYCNTSPCEAVVPTQRALTDNVHQYIKLLIENLHFLAHTQMDECI